MFLTPSTSKSLPQTREENTPLKVIAVIIYLIIVVKAFVSSLAYLKYEVRVREIITLILTGIGLLGTIAAVLKLIFFN